MPVKILEIQELTVSFDGFKALNELNFSMETGELRVIIGPNGAGKTTFLDVITGKVQPTQGKVLFKGHNLRRSTEHQTARMGIGRKFQTPRVYLNLSVRENLDLVSNRRKSVLGTLFRGGTPQEKRNVTNLLDTVGLAEKAELKAALLSHGEKQRLEIGMLVAQSPDLLLVDEPVAGLTDEETENVGALLLALAESHSIIVIEHDMEFVRQIARQVTVLHQGSVLCEGTMDEVQNDPKVIEVYLGSEPTISAEQMNMLRIAASMAWSDRNFAPVQMEIILTRLSEQFASDAAHQQGLREELKDYLAREVPLSETVPQVKDPSDRETVLRLSYEIISANLINEDEHIAYQELLQGLDLPSETVQRIEAEVSAGLHHAQPRTISDRQMTILQIAAAMAWSDGVIAPEELGVLLSRLSRIFAENAEHQQVLRQELRQYLLKAIPVEVLVPKLESRADRELVLKLSYEVIGAATVNRLESQAYRNLVKLLDLPEAVVKRIESEVDGVYQP